MTVPGTHDQDLLLRYKEGSTSQDWLCLSWQVSRHGSREHVPIAKRTGRCLDSSNGCVRSTHHDDIVYRNPPRLPRQLTGLETPKLLPGSSIESPHPTAAR